MPDIVCVSEPESPIATGLKHCPRCGDVLTYFGYFRAMLREGSVIRGYNFYRDRPGGLPAVRLRETTGTEGGKAQPQPVCY